MLNYYLVEISGGTNMKFFLAGFFGSLVAGLVLRYALGNGEVARSVSYASGTVIFFVFVAAAMVVEHLKKK